MNRKIDRTRTPSVKVPGVIKVKYANGTIRYEARVSHVDPLTKVRAFHTPEGGPFDRFDDAADWVKDIRLKLAGGMHISSRSRSGITVTEAIANFLAARREQVTESNLALGTVSNNANSLLYLERAHPTLPINKLTTADIRGLIAKGVDGQIGRPWKTGTINLFITACHLMMDQAVLEKHIPTNVARTIRRHRVTADRKYKPATFSEDEMRFVLASSLEDDLGTAWWLALSGFRRGEIAGLQWVDVDFAGDEINICRSRVSNDGQVQEKEPKGRKERPYPMSPPLLAVMKKERLRQKEQRMALGADYTDSGYVIVNPAGEAYHPETLTKRWFQFLERIKARRIRLHDARHTFGTVMAQHPEQVNLQELSELLGHARRSFTLDNYVHSQPARLKAASDAFGAIIGGLS